MATAITTIVFDLGGVLIDWNPLYVYNELIPDPERRKYFFDHICTYPWNEEQDAGRPLQVATDQKVAEFPDWEPEIRAYYGRWEEMLGEAIEETVNILKALIDSKQYRIYALTNWSAETFPVALERFEFLQWSEGIVVSGAEKTRKPFHDFYEILYKRYDITPANAIFIDDNTKNVKGSIETGMHALHFESPEKLKDDLKKLGVTVNA